MSNNLYSAGTNGKCPHCGCTVLFQTLRPVRESGPNYVQDRPTYLIARENDVSVLVYSSQCPNPTCKKPIVASIIKDGEKTSHKLVFPANIIRTVPPEVPITVRNDFEEASAVLSISDKASAALSRRCLQNMLNQRSFKGKDLNAQIDLVLKSLPTEIGNNLDAIRQIGNFAAHPMKYQVTDEIVDVEPEEASWNLDVLEQLFDYFYVQPKLAEDKRKKLDEKLAGLGKPPLKKP
jgi:hypothetical protein